MRKAGTFIASLSAVALVGLAPQARAAVKVRILSGGQTTAVMEMPTNSTVRVSAREVQSVQNARGGISKITLTGKASISVFKDNQLLMHIAADEVVLEAEAPGVPDADAGAPDTDSSTIELEAASAIVPEVGPANAASAAVQKFFDARSAGNSKAALALLTSRLLMALPAPRQRAEQVKLFSDPAYAEQLNPRSKALAAMSLDFANKLGYTFRVLGPAKDNPNVIVVRAYPTAAPAEVATLQVVVARDAADNDLHIDNLQTGWSNGATSAAETK